MGLLDSGNNTTKVNDRYNFVSYVKCILERNIKE